MTRSKKQRGPRKASAQEPRRRPRPTAVEAASEPDDDAAPDAARDLPYGAPAPRIPLTPAVAVLRAHDGAFRAWLAETDPDDDPLEVLDDLEVLLSLGALGALGAGITDPTHLRPAQLAAVVAQLDHLGVPPDVGGDHLVSLQRWLDYLDDTGAWRGTAQDWVACTNLLSGPDLDSPLAELADALDRDPAAEAAALRDLRLVTRARALLDWVRPGRPVTGGEDPQLVDLPEALGVTGLADAERLARLWRACLDAGDVEVDGARALLSDAGELLLDGAPDERQREERALAMMAVTAAVEDPGPAPGAAHAGDALGDLLQVALREGSAPVDDRVRDRVEVLADEGLLVVDGDRFSVPGALALTVLTALVAHEQVRGTDLGAGWSHGRRAAPVSGDAGPGGGSTAPAEVRTPPGGRSTTCPLTASSAPPRG